MAHLRAAIGFMVPHRLVRHALAISISVNREGVNPGGAQMATCERVNSGSQMELA
jgi:hypothetical protein